MKNIIKNNLNNELSSFLIEQEIKEFNYDSDNTSPTFEWDIIKDDIKTKANNIKDYNDIKEFFKNLTSKIKELPSSTKTKIKKYALTTLVSVVGLTMVNKAFNNDNNQPQELTKANITKELPSKKDTVNTKEYIIPNQYSNNLVNFLKYEEGNPKKKGEPVLKAYDLGDGKITIGYGHAEDKNTTNLKVGDTITKEKAEELLKQDITTAKDAVDDVFSEWKKKKIPFKISQGMYDAMISMAYNMGRSGFRGSDFIQLVKQGKYKEAKNKILSTNITYAGHKPRREKESKMFKI